ncbi:hypothetical protein [Pontibacter roseus]|uniref:hypothetical protein n=1 Tax=Pontibacter roseus TaxID=336989 RepID=UPI00037AEDF8|nr:hypothetical protein [Pontibacter roseus]
MKPRFILLFTAAMCCTLASCGKDEKEETPVPEAVDKRVVFEVYTTTDYTKSQYANREASITLRIRRGDMGMVQETTVFDTTFVRALKDIPLQDGKLVIKKTVPAVLNGEEWVAIGSGYSVGDEAFGSSEFLPAEQREFKVRLSL